MTHHHHKHTAHGGSTTAGTTNAATPGKAGALATKANALGGTSQPSPSSGQPIIHNGSTTTGGNSSGNSGGNSEHAITGTVMAVQTNGDNRSGTIQLQVGRGHKHKGKKSGTMPTINGQTSSGSGNGMTVQVNNGTRVMTKGRKGSLGDVHPGRRVRISMGQDQHASVVEVLVNSGNNSPSTGQAASNGTGPAGTTGMSAARGTSTAQVAHSGTGQTGSTATRPTGTTGHTSTTHTSHKQTGHTTTKHTGHTTTSKHTGHTTASKHTSHTTAKKK
jgi:hypothetical protein